MTGTLRALTIRQPYAERIVHGTKRVENRTRPIAVRGMLLIHAAAQPHERFRGKPMGHLPSSAIVGAAQLVGSHNAETCQSHALCYDAGGEYAAPGAPPVHHWMLDDVIAFDDADVVRDVRGMLGIWTLTEPTMIGRVRLALEAAGHAR